ncbi:hypothetical protein QFC20_004355 [Naganishia adeliensis]|uniref:Uncharacterized protein n=1 Tax=Naganishia adeliensis TaxID=92952 RepID=A0ACC2W0H0_9TREE|nr:hypothetical protein QFC20_004355 [Naganishia adeliensis]
MSESEEKPPLDTVDDAHPSPTERTPPTYPAQRIARCIMRFLLMVLYLLFLYMEPSNDFSVSTIAGSDEGMHFGAIRSCAGSVCTELLQRQDQHAVGTFAQVFLAVGALVISGFVCNFLSLLRADAPKEKTHGIRKRAKRWLALTSARCRTLSRIMAYILVPAILFLGIVLAADVSLSTSTYDASLFLGGPLARESPGV